MHRLLASLVAALVLAACTIAPNMPGLVRDSAGVFTPPARQAAEERLRSLSQEHGILFFIVTDHRGDPPRMLDAPGADAQAFGRPFVAFLLSGEGMVGGGMSDADRFASMPSPNVDDLLAEGRGDEALDTLVAAFATWAASDLPEP